MRGWAQVLCPASRPASWSRTGDVIARGRAAKEQLLLDGLDKHQGPSHYRHGGTWLRGEVAEGLGCPGPRLQPQ